MNKFGQGNGVAYFKAHIRKTTEMQQTNEAQNSFSAALMHLFDTYKHACTRVCMCVCSEFHKQMHISSSSYFDLIRFYSANVCLRMNVVLAG